MARRDRGLEGFGRDGPGGRGRVRAGRLFDQGDLKYVVLRLIAEQPRHGYDIIRAMEDRVGGVYSPSPGTVYPTLALLSAAGYATVRGERGRKVFEITETGRAYLAEHRDTADAIFERIARYSEALVDPAMVEVNAAFRRLGRAAYRQAARDPADAERLARVREILERATAALEEMPRGAAGRPSPPP